MTTEAILEIILNLKEKQVYQEYGAGWLDALETLLIKIKEEIEIDKFDAAGFKAEEQY